MTIRMAYKIFRDISSDSYSDIEKGEAIREVVNMATHMGVTKDHMVSVIKYLWDMCFEEQAGKGDQNG